MKYRYVKVLFKENYGETKGSRIKLRYLVFKGIEASSPRKKTTLPEIFDDQVLGIKKIWKK